MPAPVRIKTRDLMRVHRLGKPRRYLLACERPLGSASAAFDAALTVIARGSVGGSTAVNRGEAYVQCMNRLPTTADLRNRVKRTNGERVSNKRRVRRQRALGKAVARKLI
jgi:5-methylcytosine-specific restriction endonuclease McrA